jgi:hypothetical protein
VAWQAGRQAPAKPDRRASPATLSGLLQKTSNLEKMELFMNKIIHF